VESFEPFHQKVALSRGVSAEVQTAVFKHERERNAAPQHFNTVAVFAHVPKKEEGRKEGRKGVKVTLVVT
jgi:hypothetical protein